MEQKERYSIEGIPLHRATFVLTSAPDYEESRLLFFDDFPEYGKSLFLSGGHCSCYDWDDVEWSATIVDRKELKKLIEGWLHGDELEKRMASLLSEFSYL